MTVLLFARLREVVGRGRLELDLPDGATAQDAFEMLAGAAPGLSEMRGRLRCAADDEYVDWATRLYDGVELALIPPTAGG